jgi:glycosyltransferase involved in cell wall biosynthesis
VHLLPAVPPGEVVAAAAGADVGLVANLHPGLNHRYTVPNRLYTCLAAGVPVVGNHSPAFERIILDNEVGTTCDVRDPGELAGAIRSVLDPERHERMRANALAFSERETWESEASRLVQLIEAIA